MLDLQGNLLSEDELERQRGEIKKCPFVVRDREHPIAEALITDGAGVVDPQLSVLTKMSFLVDALRMGGSYEIVEKLWAQLVLTAGQVNTEVAWTGDKVLVGSINFRSHFVSFQIYIVVLLLVNYINRNATPNSVTRGWLAHHLFSLEFEERGVTLWAFIRTWEKDILCRVARPCQIVSPAMPRTPCQCSGQFWLLWVVRRPLLLFLVNGMC